jgi:signal peptidase I
MAKLAQFLRSLVDLNGTASRKRGWIVFGLGQLTILLAAAASRAGVFFEPLVVVAIIAQVLIIVVLVQRLHDAGRSGYWAIFAIVPVIGPVAILLLKPSSRLPKGHPMARKVGAGLLVCYVLFGLSRVYLWQPYWIPSESMKPTLLVGDYIITTHPSRYQRGDVLALRHPVNGSNYLGRLIGLPGDRVQIRNGMVYINDSVAEQQPNGQFEEIMGPQGPLGNRPRCGNGPVSDGAICSRARLTETLPEGGSYDVLNIEDDGYADNTDVYTVPAHHYFFLGDNRDNSNDSRFPQGVGGLGYVPKENVLGEVTRVLYSTAGASMLDFFSLRSDRFWKAVA